MGSRMCVPLRVLDGSDFTPYNAKLKKVSDAQGEQSSKPDLARPTLTLEAGKELLAALAERYNKDAFQAKMVEIFKKHLISQDDVEFMRARRSLCMPIQADVLPKFGFEPTSRGLAQATALLQSRELMQDSAFHGMMDI